MDGKEMGSAHLSYEPTCENRILQRICLSLFEEKLELKGKKLLF